MTSGAAAAVAVQAVQLSEQDRQRLAELQRTDREVRAHEQAHLAVAGPYAVGGATFSTVRGPDGVLYAVGGEVSIDVSPVANDPEATIAKAQQIRRAAEAPVDPSSQDRAVAAAAAQLEAAARIELADRERQEHASPGSYVEPPPAAGTLINLLA